jgi:plastocyanin
MQSTMRRVGAVLLPLLLLLALGLAACGGTSGASTNPNAPANEVDMGSANFVQTSRTISAGESIHFVDDPSGTMHILCIGKDGQCDPNSKGPQNLTGQGFTIQPGQSHDVRFDSAGTYPITCSIHPNMNLIVTVR